MQNNSSAFRGLVIEKFGTIGNFASAMNWSGRKASYIVNGRQMMTIKEAEQCAEALEVEDEKGFLRIFFPTLSIRWTNEKGA